MGMTRFCLGVLFFESSTTKMPDIRHADDHPVPPMRTYAWPVSIQLLSFYPFPSGKNAKISPGTHLEKSSHRRDVCVSAP